MASIYNTRFRKAIAALGVAIRSAANEADLSSPVIISGAGAPSGDEGFDHTRMVYIRNDASSVDAMVYFTYDGGTAWNAVEAGTKAAADISVADAGAYYTATEVEAALQEVGLFNYRLTPPNVYRFFDDFDKYQTGYTEADAPYILNSGTDPQAVDPAIVAAEGGIMRLTSGDVGSGVAADGSQLCLSIPVTADAGGLLFEARLRINTAITNTVVNVGLTDATGLEMPCTIGGGDALTTTASDFAGFVYDSAADTDEWFGVAVDSDTDDAGSATTTVAPTADTYQRLTATLSADGATIAFAIDGTTQLTLTGDAGVSPDVSLYLTVCVAANSAASEVVDVDYLYLVHDR